MAGSTVIAVLGAGTGVGKSVATGLLAAHFAQTGSRVITQKLVQTGCKGRPDDILLHRRIQGIGWLDEDEQGLTCPYCFTYPASPHLAARLEDREVDPERISRATDLLRERFDRVLVEGVGGLLVPLTDSLLLLDYVRARNYPVILVTSPYLGAINHTLLSLEAIRNRELDLLGMVVNLHGDHDPVLVRDFIAYFRNVQQGRLTLMASLEESRSVNWTTLLDRPEQDFGEGA